MIRRIITIDEETCNGCGLCADACHEGAIGIVDGKAKLLREDYCDGLGDCLPACPMNAISFEEREAPAYNEAAVLAAKKAKEEKLPYGKYRFNDLELGTIGGLPRLMDIGQCNDAYSAIQIAVALADAFGCGVNDLPLSMVLSWYEQKAVCILLTLLHLGIKNIRLGPTLPAFVSPNVLNFLVEKFNIAPITTPEADLKSILG